MSFIDRTSIEKSLLILKENMLFQKNSQQYQSRKIQARKK
jgi:hypothetical protein